MHRNLLVVIVAALAIAACSPTQPSSMPAPDMGTPATMSDTWGAGYQGAPDGVTMTLAADGSTVLVANQGSQSWWIVPDEVRNWYGPPWRSETVTDWTGMELKAGSTVTLAVPPAARHPARAVVTLLDHAEIKLGSDEPYLVWVDLP